MWVNDKSWLLVRNVVFINAFLGAILSGIFAYFLVAAAEAYAVWIWLAIVLAVFCGVYAYQWRSRDQVMKMFYCSESDARTIVKNALQDKGLPYVQSEAIEIANTDVKITVRYGRVSRYSPAGTILSIGPMTDENALLVTSLQQKLDEAFRPRGLH